MSKANINQENFKEFLNLVKLKGFVESKEILFNSSIKSLSAYAHSFDRAFGLKGVYFHPFPDKNEVGIENLQHFYKLVELMNGDFFIEYKSNKIILQNEKNKVSYSILGLSQIANVLEGRKFDIILDKMSNKISFDLSPENSADIVKKFNVVLQDNEEGEIILGGSPGKLTIQLKNQKLETELISDYDIADIKDEFEIAISKKFVDLLSVVKIPLKLELEKDEGRALVVSASKENVYKLNYLFALNDH